MPVILGLLAIFMGGNEGSRRVYVCPISKAVCSRAASRAGIQASNADVYWNVVRLLRKDLYRNHGFPHHWFFCCFSFKPIQWHVAFLWSSSRWHIYIYSVADQCVFNLELFAKQFQYHIIYIFVFFIIGLQYIICIYHICKCNKPFAQEVSLSLSPLSLYIHVYTHVYTPT